MNVITLFSGVSILFKISFISGIAYNVYEIMLAGILFFLITMAANHQFVGI